ncbi:MAG: hypothetical protein IT356_03310 [Gemmatimonadaceae bacterium]|nr:hypothetical protein [Gemmatimonadaceae bacterium]
MPRSIAAALAALALLSASAAAQQGGAQGPTNPRMLPDVSAVGDLVADLSPKGSTQPDLSRFAVREVEVALQAVVDPYFRGDVFLGFSDAEGASIEQAFLTTTALPGGLQARLGRFLMPFGKQNTTHRHDLHTVEYPYIIQRFFGSEGLKGTGATLSDVFAPFGFYQEFMVSVTDRAGERAEGLTPAAPANRNLDGLGYSARLRNYWDISEATNIEVSGSAITSLREQPLALPAGAASGDVNAVNVRQSVFAGDVTFRWRPLQQGLYKSLILQAEVMHQANDIPSVVPPLGRPGPGASAPPLAYAGPTSGYTGGYVFGRWQLSRRLYAGARYDALQDPEAEGARFTAGSALLEWYPSEFSKLIAQYERTSPSGGPALDRILLQASFAIGPHKPHPF